MYIYNLIVEVTRTCNLKCKHCCRGCSKKDNFSTKYLDNVFDGIEQIGCITFTGGEPLLRVRTIIKVLKYIREHNIGLESFYIVHNGTKYSKRLMEVLKDFYDNYCYEKEMCGFSLSSDEFHREEILKKKLRTYYNEYLTLQYCGYDFIRDDRKEIGFLILSGRGKVNKNIIRTKQIKAYYNSGFYESTEDDNMVYVSANGNVISNCDLSYDLVDKKSFGNVGKERLFDIIARNTVKDVEVIYC